MAEDARAVVRQMVEKVWNGGDLDLVDVLVAPDYVGRDPSYPEPVRGPDGFRRWVGMARALFPDFTVEIEQLVAEDDVVCGRIRMTGTHRGDVLGPATGVHVAFTGMFMRRVQDGRFVEGWDQADTLGMLRQIGLVPTPGA